MIVSEADARIAGDGAACELHVGEKWRTAGKCERIVDGLTAMMRREVMS